MSAARSPSHGGTATGAGSVAGAAASGEGLTPITVAIEDLRAATEDMEEAAWREGIDPTGPLGVFVQSMRKVLVIVGELAMQQASGVAASVRDARALSEGELAKLREMLDLSRAALDQARTAHAGIEVQREKAFGKVVESIVPEMVKAVGEAVVIRERRHNRRVEWGRAAGIATVAGSLLLGGFVWGSWRPSDAAVAGAVALERIRQCQAAPVKDGRTGEAFCPMKVLLAPS